MENKIFTPGLNTIIYTSKGRDAIIQFALSSKWKGIDYLDLNSFTFRELANKAVKSRKDDILTVSMMQIDDNIPIELSKYASNLKNPKENIGIIEASHVVVSYDAENDNFLIIKHRYNKDLGNTRVLIDQLM